MGQFSVTILGHTGSVLSDIQHASHYIAEINAIHPFREGNGRCQLTLLSILMELSGFDMDEDSLDPKEFMEAMIASFHGDNEPLSHSILTMAN